DELAFPAARPADESRHLKINLLEGGGVAAEGTAGHVRAALDALHRRGELAHVKGVPTVMIGEIDDPHFEEHLRQGPYVVFDTAAKPKYKNDPRVYFVPGHPVLRTAMPELMKGMGVRMPGEIVQKWQQFHDWGMHTLEYGSW